MAEQKHMIRCDECKKWFRMAEDHSFSQPIFEYPTYWFRLLGRKIDEHKVMKEFCSWLCTKNFVDKQYAVHHHEDPR